ncbi:glycosyltransferase [Candidatus Saccharibacteria bacterium]|nr:glycosyltransferase [Candidatus Saccharibacteria bacterium]
MEKPKVSIVVPIYNVERYLEECIESLLAQTLEEIEIILIDDGSPDRCGEIVDRYAEKDARVVAVHRKNEGYSKAVNYGIRLARGEYIGIIESDDWVEPTMYEKLYKRAGGEVDVVKCGFWTFNSAEKGAKRNVYYKNPSGVDLRKAPEANFTVRDWPKIVAFHASIWAALYRAEFIKKIPLLDTTGASYQDFPFAIETLCRAKKIAVFSEPLVHWRNDPDQVHSTSAKGEKLLYMAKNSATGIAIARELGIYESIKEALIVHVLWANVGFFYAIEKKYQKSYYQLMHEILKAVEVKGELFTPADWKFFKLMNKRTWTGVKLHMFLSKVKGHFFG